MSEKKIIIEAIYLQESNIETPNQLEVFEERITKIDTDLACQSGFQNTAINKEERYEVSLSFQIASKFRNKYLYILNFVQCGLFQIEGYNQKEVDEVLAVDCPNMLFPYARLHANYITTQTGLAPIVMQEINFKELYYNEIGKTYK